MVILSVPTGVDGDKVTAMARETLPSVELTPAVLSEDICFYREYPQIPLIELPQLAGARPAKPTCRWAATTHPIPAPT